MDEILASDLEQMIINCKIKRAVLTKLQLLAYEPQKWVMVHKPLVMQSLSTEES